MKKKIIALALSVFMVTGMMLTGCGSSGGSGGGGGWSGGGGDAPAPDQCLTDGLLN